MPVTITEEFDSPLGQPQNYDMYLAASRDALLAKRHVNLRSFIQTNITLTLDMQSFELDSMQDLNALTMNDLEADLAYFAGEAWTGGTCAPDATNHNINTLSVACVANVQKIASSVVLNSSNSKLTTQEAEPNVKVLMDVDPTATVAVTIPGLFSTSLTNASCYLEITSEPTGAFTDYTVSLPFSAGDIQASSVSWPLTAITATKVGTHYLDPSAITGVRVRLLSTVTETIKVTALRALGTNWDAPFAGDWDTRYQRFARVVDLNGNLDNLSEAIFRAAYPPGQDFDPHPIDVKLTCAFNAGTVGTDTNTFTFYFRERAEDYQTQLNLDTFTQKNLEDILAQPDYAQSIFASRQQGQLEIFEQTDLDSQTQAELEEEPDLFAAAWIEAALVWDGTTTKITVKDTATIVGDEYVLTAPTLTPAKDYLLTLDLELHTLSIKLQLLDEHGTASGSPIWQESITDDSMFRRRKGRVGWNLNLLDGQAYIDGIRTAKTMYAEYQSLPFRSVTPADGIELFVSAMPDRELVQGLDPGPYGGTVVPDVTHTNSGDGAFKVTTNGTALQGVMTTPVLIDDFDSTSLQFDVYYPQSAIDQGGHLQAVLLGDRGRILELPLPQIPGDRWQTIRFSSISNNNQQTGNYRLVLWQTAAIPSSWWLDNISMKARSMSWGGRVNQDSDWLDFRDTYNADRSGVRFLEPGFETQVRGQALRQDAYISKVAFKPRYAELGRLVWPEDKPALTLPTAVIAESSAGLTATLDGTASTAQAGTFLIDWTWYFGDGDFAHGPYVSHTYSAPGTYDVILVVTDNHGNRDSASTTLTPCVPPSAPVGSTQSFYDSFTNAVSTAANWTTDDPPFAVVGSGVQLAASDAFNAHPNGVSETGNLAIQSTVTLTPTDAVDFNYWLRDGADTGGGGGILEGRISFADDGSNSVFWETSFYNGVSFSDLSTGTDSLTINDGKYYFRVTFNSPTITLELFACGNTPIWSKSTTLTGPQLAVLIGATQRVELSGYSQNGTSYLNDFYVWRLP